MDIIKQKVLVSGVKNTGDVDLSNYYNKQEVEALIPTDYITEIPDEYVTDDELDAKGYLTEHQSLDNYYTKTEVDNKVANGGSFDSSLYYTKEEVDAKGYITEVPAEYITEDELNNKGYLTEHLDLTEYAKKSDIPTDYYTKEEVDNKVASGGTFDSTQYYTKNEVDAKIPTDYLKEVPSEYITESELNSKGYLTEHLDISNLATKDDLNAYQLKGDYLTEVPSEYVTETELAGKGYLTEHQDLSEYAKKSDIPTDYLTAIPEEYVTETELTGKGYLTEHQSLENYYTKEEVNAKVAEGGTFDSSLYYNKAEVDAKIPTDYITSIPEEYVTDDELNAKGYLTQHQDLSDYAKKSDIPTDYLTEIPAEYVTETELEAKGYLTEHLDISGKQDVIADLETIRSGAALGTTALLSVPDTYALKTDIPDTSNLATKDELPAEYDDTELTGRVSALETSLGNIDTLLDNINGEVV